MSERIPEKIQTMRAWPTLPLFLSTPLGDTKIPAPTMIPTMMATPSHRPSSFFSLTPWSSSLGPAATASGRRTGFSAGATLSGIPCVAWNLKSSLSKSEHARARGRMSRAFPRDDSECTKGDGYRGVPSGHYRECVQRDDTGGQGGDREFKRWSARAFVHHVAGASHATYARAELMCRATIAELPFAVYARRYAHHCLLPSDLSLGDRTDATRSRANTRAHWRGNAPKLRRSVLAHVPKSEIGFPPHYYDSTCFP